MVFQFDPPQQVMFWMKDTPSRLIGVWVGSDQIVIGYWHGTPYSLVPHASPAPVRLVIEYPPGYRIPAMGSRARLAGSCKPSSGKL
jgi:uncharacterized membrane protein (UPF0127 family)